MMYFEKIVCSLKVGGKFLREENGVVKIPFSSEYSLWLKNMESRDAVVSISIDGNDVLDGNRIVIPANKHVEILGFMKGDSVRKKFKFIELTKDIENHRGYFPEDSLIRIETTFKKKEPEVTYTYTDNYKWNPYIWIYYRNPFDYTTTTWKPFQESRYDVSCYSTSNSNSSNDAGITVHGGECKQDFSSTYVGELENNSHVFVLRLSGYNDGKKVENIVTTKDKIICDICGKHNHFDNKFCSSCGNSLK